MGSKAGNLGGGWKFDSQKIIGIPGVPQMERCHSQAQSLKQRVGMGFTKFWVPSWVVVHIELLPRDGEKQAGHSFCYVQLEHPPKTAALRGYYHRAKKHSEKQSTLAVDELLKVYQLPVESKETK